ncbi:MAG: energy-coupling factor ABC transporter permease [Candidatus Gastranaerophilales bacterium]|nr:energy-coupling factor ABC transporter permease [Candidatus Gastranaerophilales bacterium]
MNHLHIPDGVFPIWFWGLAYVIVFVYLAIILKFCKTPTKKMALAGMFSALMLVAMSIELPIGYHLNFAVLAGILLGPTLSVLVIFVVNTFLAFLGHGGITVIGLNTIVLSLEALIAFGLYRFIFVKNKNIFIKGFLSAFISLVLTSFISAGIVYAGVHDLSYMHHSHHGHKHEHNLEHHEQEMEFDIKKFLLLLIATGSIGWVIESSLTGGALQYIKKVKPEILD